MASLSLELCLAARCGEHVRIRLAIPDRLVTPEALEAALEATSLANEQAIIRGEVPPIEDAIAKGVKWKPEPFLDGEHFDLSHVVASRGWGDCDDLAPWLTGTLRATGEDPGARSRVYKTGRDRWHVVTETSDGEILDPSKWAGMGKKSGPAVRGVCGMIAQPFARIGEGALCCVPHGGKYWSRVDLPFPDAIGHIASHARAYTPEESLYRAVAGAIACGEELDSELVDRVRLMGAMLLTDPDDLDEMNGDEMEIGFFGKLLKPLGKLAKSAIKFVPGVGPIADTALDAASALMKKKKGGGKGSAVRRLSKGGGKSKPSRDTIVHPPSGAVSVPIATPASQGGAQPAMLYYHPANSIGPVVMRF